MTKTLCPFKKINMRKYTQTFKSDETNCIFIATAMFFYKYFVYNWWTGTLTNSKEARSDKTVKLNNEQKAFYKLSPEKFTKDLGQMINWVREASKRKEFLRMKDEGKNVYYVTFQSTIKKSNTVRCVRAMQWCEMMYSD